MSANIGWGSAGDLSSAGAARLSAAAAEHRGYAAARTRSKAGTAIFVEPRSVHTLLTGGKKYNYIIVVTRGG